MGEPFLWAKQLLRHPTTPNIDFQNSPKIYTDLRDDQKIAKIHGSTSNFTVCILSNFDVYKIYGCSNQQISIRHAGPGGQCIDHVCLGHHNIYTSLETIHLEQQEHNRHFLQYYSTPLQHIGFES